MGENSSIEWCHHTFSPWEGCAKVSEGCRNCYAEERNARFHPREDKRPDSDGFGSVRGEHWGVNAPRLMRAEAYWSEPARWDRDARAAGERRRVFCASLADVFEDRPDLVEPRDRLLSVIGGTPNLDWMLLTKRPENMVRLTKHRWPERWPSHVWAGTTVEDQRAAERRILWLAEVPARVRFLSCEPLIGPLDLRNVDMVPMLKADRRPNDPSILLDALTGHVKGPDEVRPELAVNLVIVGGESGRNARPFDLRWARSIVEQCRAAGVPCFVKQLGERPVDANGPLKLSDKKGGDPAEWPEDLRVRQFPKGAQ